MIPYKTIFKINRKSNQPIYIQLTNTFIELIKKGTLPPNTKLPGSRTLAELLVVHRKTVIACYDDLNLQGWTESIPKKGKFINANLPELNQQKLSVVQKKAQKQHSGFSFSKETILDRKFPHVNDGGSDSRLTPTEEISKIYRNLSGKKEISKHISYGTTYGNHTLRETLVNYLNETRGLNITVDNLMITRGSQMGMYLAAQLLFRNNEEYLIIGETNYSSSDTTFEYSGANILRIPVDEKGLDTSKIEELCKKHTIKAIYTTSHHHHPTTVTLSAERRIHLLNLSKKYKFAIIEDDYDYDFHYSHAPILPLASHDTDGTVIYVGSICKSVAPVYRVGYLVASKDFVDECAKLRRFIDRQGDAILELTFARFIKYGGLDRHIKKVLKIYKSRKEHFCSLLKNRVRKNIFLLKP
jgi:GntR family transcriptional regulator/MocR family aminotransferase